jgi:hypothetical protein
VGWNFCPQFEQKFPETTSWQFKQELSFKGNVESIIAQNKKGFDCTPHALDLKRLLYNWLFYPHNPTYFLYQIGISIKDDCNTC